MDWESLGGGAATGIIGAILIVLGWGKRIDSLEANKADKAQLTSLDNLVHDYREELRYLRNRIDEIYTQVVSK